MKQVFGVLALLLGVLMLGVLLYDLFAGLRNGGTQINQFGAVAFILLMFSFGFMWVRGKSLGAAESADTAPPPVEAPAPAAGGGGQRPRDLAEVVRIASVEKTSAQRMNKLDQMRHFDLTKLNWVGWLLLAGSFAVAIAGAIVTGIYVDRHKDWLGERAFALIAVPVLGLSIGFFFGCRWLLRQVGVSVYRPERGAPADGGGH